jgi:hypothetical protein
MRGRPDDPPAKAAGSGLTSIPPDGEFIVKKHLPPTIAEKPSAP